MNFSPPPADLQDKTRDRLLVTAREVFAELGFKGATVREICRRAGVNLAAVNYHFNGKEALYKAALEFAPIKNLIAAADATGGAELRLQGFIGEFMAHLMDGRCAPHSQLMMRELLEPSPALDSIAREIIWPLHEYLTRLVREIVGEAATADEVRRCVFSIFGQCGYYRHAREMNRRVYPELEYSAQEIAATARHIAAFSLAGLHQVAEKYRNNGEAT